MKDPVWGVASRSSADALDVHEREYQLVVEGELSDRAGQAFNNMTLTRRQGKTVIAGMVRDQAELQSVLRRISDLGLTLLSATTEDTAHEQ